MKKVILLIMLVVGSSAYSQEINKEKALDPLMESLTDILEKEIFLRSQQIHDIGGIPFGISREDALPRLRNKYGEPEYNPQSTVVTFKHIKYAGRDFSAVHFLFESDGIHSYLNACFFVNEAKTKSEAIKKMEDLKTDLEKRYSVSSVEGENGFMMYGGGVGFEVCPKGGRYHEPPVTVYLI